MNESLAFAADLYRAATLADYPRPRRSFLVPVPSASSVSAALRRAGFLPIPAERQTEGVRVKRGYAAGRVTVVCDFDAPAEQARIAADAAELLTGLGYAVERVGGHLYVTAGSAA